MIRLYALVFALSGISGLIYESVWSHYIKLILGHAALAQTLVLTIFMGGMAGGSWLASRVSRRLPSLLLAYAAVEAVIGFIAIAFQPIFETCTQLLFDTVLPALDPGASAVAAKLAFAALLILPQSILLGATFPLMSGGALRVDRRTTGSTVALLYFANSIGAVIGVLWSGFWLISAVGLPGTLLTAGLINVTLALLVFGFVRFGPKEIKPAEETPLAEKGGPPLRWILWAAAITGAASFCYEIAWIRMLSMVLGASTHSFELMLASFILGLSLGGLWIKRRIDTLKNPKLFLGIVQLVMGALALATLPLYNHVFEIMAAAMQGIARTDQGYALFSLTGNAIAMLVMVPATFCAGMTLPLLTFILLQTNRGEKAIGQVYAANTLGSIIGVITAVHLVLPGTSLKGLLLFGTLLDGALGLYLIAGALRGRLAATRYGAVGCFALAWLLSLQWAEFDPKRMVTGVYRNAVAIAPDSFEVLRWKDGKTASSSLIRNANNGHITISTNGKPDASVNVSGSGAPASDESTMVLAAVAPLLHSDKIKTVANIGLGSGMTTHTLLAVPGIERVDTIEIEPEMVNSARQGFGERLPRTFSDPRSHLVIDDARSYFSSRGKFYDLIVSEPSNPWVSGVASLFSVEFYNHITRYLAQDGVFVQWIQIYETSPSIVASIMGALGQSFDDYLVYAPNGADMLIVAKKHGKLASADYQILKHQELRGELRKVGLATPEDIALRLVGSKALWSPMLESIGGTVPNSDFFPFVDQNAARFRFLNRSDTTALLLFGNYPVPLLEALALRNSPPEAVKYSDNRELPSAANARIATDIRDYLFGVSTTSNLPAKFWEPLGVLTANVDCSGMLTAQVDAMFDLFGNTIPHLHPKEMNRLWARIVSLVRCNKADGTLTLWLEYYRALSNRDWVATERATKILLESHSKGLRGPVLESLVLANLVSCLATDNRTGFVNTVKTHLIPGMQQIRLRETMPTTLILAHGKSRGWIDSSWPNRKMVR